MGILDDLANAAGVLRKADKIKEYQIILNAQEKILELQKRISELEDENKRLRENDQIKNNLEYKEKAYWYNSDGAFCTRCWDKEQNLIRMKTSKSHDGSEFHECPECKNIYYV